MLEAQCTAVASQLEAVAVQLEFSELEGLSGHESAIYRAQSIALALFVFRIRMPEAQYADLEFTSVY